MTLEKKIKDEPGKEIINNFLAEGAKSILGAIGALFYYGFNFLTYSFKFSLSDRFELLFSASSRVANRYSSFRKHKRFNIVDIAHLAEFKIPLEEALKYNKRFNGSDIVHFNLSECCPEKVNQFSNNFSIYDIAPMIRFGVPPDVASQYKTSELQGKTIAILYNLKIRPGEVGKETNQPIIDMLEKSDSFDVSDLPNKYSKFESLGIGSQGIVFLVNGHAWKIGKNIDEEYEKYKRLKNTKNVINLLDWYIGDNLNSWGFKTALLELEYVKGETIEHLCRNNGVFKFNRLLKYSHDILNGILEMRRAGLFHRDLNDRNVVIDGEKDRAIIIDLGAATDDPEDICDKTTTYAGNNDLISAAQLMYKMATGHHLFKEGPGFTQYSEVKQGIKTEREKAYENPELLQTYFQKVRQNVPGELGELIVTLLNDDLWTQPSLERVQEAKEMFERYLR